MCANTTNNIQVPSNPKNKLRNPLELFTYGSLHGGIWRMAYKVGPSVRLSYPYKTRTCTCGQSVRTGHGPNTHTSFTKTQIDSIGEPAAFLYLFTTPVGIMVLVAFWAVVIGLLKQYLLGA